MHFQWLIFITGTLICKPEISHSSLIVFNPELLTEDVGRDAEASEEEKAHTSSTSAMCDSDLDYEGNALKAEILGSAKTGAVGEEETETETEPTMPLLTPSVVSPEPKAEAAESSVSQ